MALAGRAARRMREATGREAITIAGFLHQVDDERLSAATHVVIDEASMLDVAGFSAVLRRLSGRANLLLVGDDFQLPPVGAGRVLHVLAGRDGVPTTRLDRIWRQGEGSAIRDVAAAIRDGRTPDLADHSGADDAATIVDPRGDPTGTCALLHSSLSGSSGRDVRVVTPRRGGGPGGAASINAILHDLRGHRRDPVIGPMGDTGSRIGDELVCDVNHWDADLMNGTLGTVVDLAGADEIDSILRSRGGRAARTAGTPLAGVVIDGERRVLDDRHLLDCSWGWALTCHRTQGSDFDAVVVVMDDAVDASWLYTAVTRARRRVVVVGTGDLATAASTLVAIVERLTTSLED